MVTCQSTGEVCLYATHMEKLHSLAVANSAMAENSTRGHLFDTAAEGIKKVLDTESQCDAGYCKMLASAMTEAILTAAFVKHSVALQEGLTKD